MLIKTSHEIPIFFWSAWDPRNDIDKKISSAWPMCDHPLAWSIADVREMFFICAKLVFLTHVFSMRILERLWQRNHALIPGKGYNVPVGKLECIGSLSTSEIISVSKIIFLPCEFSREIMWFGINLCAILQMTAFVNMLCWLQGGANAEWHWQHCWRIKLRRRYVRSMPLLWPAQRFHDLISLRRELYPGRAAKTNAIYCRRKIQRSVLILLWEMPSTIYSIASSHVRILMSSLLGSFWML
jgi:hypothetical protein